MDKDLAFKLAQDLKIDIEQIIREWWEMIILRDLFSSSIGSYLCLKGGTALRLAYGSPRFSEDLDFSVIKKFSFKLFEKEISIIEKRYTELGITDIADNSYTYIAQYRIKEFWRPLALSIKIEISKRTVDKKAKPYELVNLKSRVNNVEALGNVMRIESIYKEKLQALETRNEARDLFDIWYLSGVLNKPFSPVRNKFKKRILVRDLRKYLPKNYWKVIDILGGR
ncbi:MAG: nucleotidyl transferase AbiEii/AbiGii toxin family protein [Candidatus Omnitrophica bacterium]|nr:nucleotidyl transferase AbiEii/AbiGii toxin family protein [Candidatus Omnitrophota bacterium]